MTEVCLYQDPTADRSKPEPWPFRDRGEPIYSLEKRKPGTVSRSSSTFLVSRGDRTTLVTASVLSVFRWSGDDYGAPGAKDVTLRQLNVRHFPSNSLTSFQQVAYPGSMSRLHDVADLPRRTVTSLRDQFADFQDGGSHKDYTFWDLLRELVKKVWLTMCAVFSVIVALLPILAVFAHVFRFLLEKFVELLDPNSSWVEFFKKTTIFLFESAVVFICIYFLMVLVFFPIYIMAYAIVRSICFFLF